jgi:hypothetical protein
MIVTLQIDQDGAGSYLARYHAAGVDLTEATLYTSIADAICAEIWTLPEGIAQLVEVRYGDLSGGTWHVEELADQAGPIALRLVDLENALK